MTDVLKYPRGSVIQFTTGAYSDFSTVGLVVTIVGCDLAALAQRFWRAEKMRIAETLKADPNADVPKPDKDDFPAWLVANGHVMPIDAAEVHLGSYGDFHDEFGVSS